MHAETTPEKEALRRAMAVCGGQAAFAAGVGVSRGDRRIVWQWLQPARQVPAEYCPDIERLTREKGVPILCEQLRPDINWSVLRENCVKGIA